MTTRRDEVLDAFLGTQDREGMDLAAASDILDLRVVGGNGRRQYLATFRCRGAVSDGGKVREAEQFTVGYYFGRDYLRSVDPLRAVALLGPLNTWHPNIRAPFVCLGPIRPGTPLTDLIYRTFELLTFVKCTMREDDALNREACSWARSHKQDFPYDARPLKRARAAEEGNVGNA
jgi:hypothetical protein